MTSPQEQFTELTRRTQENFKHLWEQWSQRSSELMKGMGSRSRSASDAPGNPEEVLDAVFDSPAFPATTLDLPRRRVISCV